jgi:hypothetical protein
VKRYSLTHLSDGVLLRELNHLVSQERGTTAALLAHMAEVDARRLYLPAAYPSMFAYCVGELRLSEDSAFKRIQVARAGRRFPALFEALAEGRLHLSAAVLLAPHLGDESVDDLIAAASHKRKSEIEELLAERFPRPDVPARVLAIAPAASAPCQLAPGQVPASAGRGSVTPLSPQAFAIQFTISRDTKDKLRHAQALLSHQIPDGNIPDVFDRALDALITQLEKRKFAATGKPRPARRPAPADGRHIPAHVRRAVWERDGGRCTFVSESGRRCEARGLLEFDHVEALARGGVATVGRIRLRCRAHNQYAAERTFGAEFMRHKRHQAAAARAENAARAMGQARVAARTQAAEVRAAEARATELTRRAAEQGRATEQTWATEHAPAAEQAGDRDVIPWLRRLGFRADEARRAATLCDHLPDAPLGERVRVALTYFRARTGPPGRAIGVATAR